MDFVETKFFYKIHVLELNLKNENMSKNGHFTMDLGFNPLFRIKVKKCITHVLDKWF